MGIRRATADDVDRMVALIEEERTRMAEWQPTMWRKALNSAEKTSEWFPILIQDENVISIVHEQNGQIDGFLVAIPQPAPPVYDPGLTFVIDDFCVAKDDRWPSLGGALLDYAINEARGRHAAQCISISPIAHHAKMEVLKSRGLEPATIWSSLSL
ncbi:MAG: N-acetyltransferase [Parvibaculaceae bacterium]